MKLLLLDVVLQHPGASAGCLLFVNESVLTHKDRMLGEHQRLPGPQLQAPATCHVQRPVCVYSVHPGMASLCSCSAREK